MFKKLITIAALYICCFSVISQPLLDNQKLEILMNVFNKSDLKSVENELLIQCKQAWQSHKALTIFTEQSKFLSLMLPLKDIVERNVDHTCQCLLDNPDFQGSLVGAFFIKRSLRDPKRAQKFFEHNLSSSIRSCFWKRSRDLSGQYISRIDINQENMMKHCKASYTHYLLEKALPDIQPSVQQVLAKASVAEDKCSCLISRSLVTRITGFTADLLTYEMSEQKYASGMEWRERNLNRYILRVAGKCDIN